MIGLKLRRLGLIMEPEPGNPHEIEGTLNPAAARGPDGHLYLFPRLVAKGNYSRIGVARVKFKLLRIETLAPAVIHWSADDWSTVQDAESHDTGLGIYLADLVTNALPEGKQIKFTFYWPEAGHWEGKNFIVDVGSWPQDGSTAKKRGPDEK